MTMTDKPSAGSDAYLANELMNFSWVMTLTNIRLLEAAAARIKELSRPPVAGAEVREALIAAKCTSPDGTYVHASMREVLAALSPPVAAPNAELIRRSRNATIEECARVAKRWGDGRADVAAEEILLLKSSTPVAERGGGGAQRPTKSVDEIAADITEEIRCEERARERVSKAEEISGDIYLLKVLLSVIDSQNAALREYEAAASSVSSTSRTPTPETGDGSETGGANV